ncbi:MAG: hypothetical protein J2P31_14410 [Blastocatellia bacterium]|nr:hypothetical protein [Blastocatellia bacterium]
MGLTLRYLDDSRGVMATASGAVTGKELIGAVRRVNAFAVNTKAICYTFFDFAEVSEISISTTDLAKAAECAIEAAKLVDTERIIAIFARDEFAYRLALIYMTFIEQTGWQAWAFRDRAEAIAWLRSHVARKHGIIVDID